MSGQSCDICDYARAHGSWPPSIKGTHCGLDQRGPDHDCHRTWRSKVQSHCAECHRHFGSNRAGDLHRSKGKCHDPRDTERWETPNGVIWGGKDSVALGARLQNARKGVAGKRQSDETAAT